jgi:hypothetical protein
VKRRRMTSIDECPRGRRSRSSPFRTRHRSPGLATLVRLPTLVRSMMLSHVRARPHWYRTEFALGRSVRGLAPLVDFCNRIAPRARPWTIRTPRTAWQSPTNAAPLADGCDPDARPLPCSRGALHLGGRPTERSRARDRVSAVSRLHRLDASLRDRSRQRASPRPARLGHLMLRTRDATDWSLRHARAPLPAPAASSPWRQSVVSTPTPDRIDGYRRSCRQGCSRLLPAKGRTRNISQGAFRRRPDPPWRSGASTACPQAVDWS